ncbi:MAG: hypothetical protein M3O46_01720 [Myxococcota bacterium]|nr:hypothetical protein [Myxococcota bacterium]
MPTAPELHDEARREDGLHGQVLRDAVGELSLASCGEVPPDDPDAHVVVDPVPARIQEVALNGGQRAWGASVPVERSASEWGGGDGGNQRAREREMEMLDWHRNLPPCQP